MFCHQVRGIRVRPLEWQLQTGGQVSARTDCRAFKELSLVVDDSSVNMHIIGNAAIYRLANKIDIFCQID